MLLPKNWRLVVLALTLTGASSAVPARHLVHTADRFVGYYRALENSKMAGAFWERVAVSIVLAAAGSVAAPERTDSAS